MINQTLAISLNGGAEFKHDRKVASQICGQNNHTALECWNQFDHAYQSEELREALAALTLHEANDANIYVDSGVTSYVVNNRGKIRYTQPYYGTNKIYIGNEKGLHITHTGQTFFKTKNGQLNINNILIVSDMRKNLLSVSKLTKDNNCYISLFADKFVVKNPQGQILTEGYEKRGLYRLGGLQQNAKKLPADFNSKTLPAGSTTSTLNNASCVV